MNNMKMKSGIIDEIHQVTHGEENDPILGWNVYCSFREGTPQMKVFVPIAVMPENWDHGYVRLNKATGIFNPLLEVPTRPKNDELGNPIKMESKKCHAITGRFLRGNRVSWIQTFNKEDQEYQASAIVFLSRRVAVKDEYAEYLHQASPYKELSATKPGLKEAYDLQREDELKKHNYRMHLADFFPQNA